jgi:thiamine-monophosphate kinase
MNEDEIIRLMKGINKFPEESELSFYDDAWAFRTGGQYFTIATDMLVASTDVVKGTGLEYVGRKAMVSSISDLSSKGVRPKYYMISVGLTREIGMKGVKTLARGFSMAIKEYGGYIVGGDTNEADDLSVCVTSFGTSKYPPVRREIGKEGDIIAVTGTFGDAAAGLKIMSNEARDKAYRRKFLRAFLFPKARLAEGVALSRANVLSGCTDSSDGLALSIYNLIDSSEGRDMGVRLDLLPHSEELERFCLKNGLDLSELVLHGGEEYELVAVVKRGRWKTAQGVVEKAGGRLLKIGEVVHDRGVWWRRGNELVKVERRGWRHFVNVR